jgi:hypothetical protein
MGEVWVQCLVSKQTTTKKKKKKKKKKRKRNDSEGYFLFPIYLSKIIPSQL